MGPFFQTLLLSGILVFTLTQCAQAASPLQVAVYDPVQVVADFENVNGFRLNLFYGVNFNVSGLDVGIINQVDGKQKGVQLGIYNNSLETSGVQIGLVNRTGWLYGLQIGLVNINTYGKRKFLPIVNFSF